MKKFRIAGKFLMGGRMQPFAKELSAGSERMAVEAAYSDIGSKHKTKRMGIKIEKVEELKG